MDKPKYVLLIPLTFNDGSPIPEQTLKETLTDLYQLCDGYFLGSKGTGAYRMKSGKKQVEELIEVWVAIEDSKSAALRRLVGKIASRLGQEAIYFERTGGTVEFIAPTSTEEDDDEQET